MTDQVASEIVRPYGVSVMDSILLFGRPVDVAYYGDRLHLIHLCRDTALYILQRAAVAWAQGISSRRFTLRDKQLIKGKVSTAFFPILDTPYSTNGGVMWNTWEGKPSERRLVFETGTHKVVIKGFLPQLDRACDCCGRYGRQTCPCGFRYCTIFCAWANPQMHRLPCPS